MARYAKDKQRLAREYEHSPRQTIKCCETRVSEPASATQVRLTIFIKSGSIDTEGSQLFRTTRFRKRAVQQRRSDFQSNSHESRGVMSRVKRILSSSGLILRLIFQYKTLLILILAGEAAFLLPFVLPRIFRPTVLAVFEMNNKELGSCFSLYGIVALISYLLGGPVADAFAPRKLIAFALWSTAIGGLLMATYPSHGVMQLLYAYWGFTTIFLLWAALLKATRQWGGSAQGKAFGFLDGGRGLVSALLGSAGVILFSLTIGSPNTGDDKVTQATTSDVGGAEVGDAEGNDTENNNETGQIVDSAETIVNEKPSVDSDTTVDAGANGQIDNQKVAFRYVILFTSGLVAVIGTLVWFFLSDGPNEDGDIGCRKPISVADMKSALALPSVWLLMVIVLCGYVGYKATDDLSLYAAEVMQMNDVRSAQVGTLLLYLRPLVGVAAGFLADWTRSATWIIAGFASMLVGAIMIGSGVIEPGAYGVFFVSLFATCIGVYAIRSLYFAAMQEGKIPLSVTGTAIGLISVVGYTPDIFMGPVMGHLLEDADGVSYGEPGHQNLFWLLATLAVVGLVASTAFRMTIAKETTPPSSPNQ